MSSSPAGSPLHSSAAACAHARDVMSRDLLPCKYPHVLAFPWPDQIREDLIHVLSDLV